jgi:anti-sigma28 factor (negative regulator of flagellin synthesis)
MDKLEKLIAELQGFKEEVSKNMNQSYGGSSPNGDQSSMQMSEKVNLDNPYGDKAKAGKNEKGRNDKNDKEPELKAPEVGNSKRSQPSIKKGEMEVCKWDANGQWSLKKDAANPKLAPKDVKVKQLQQQIDAGKYKPDASKIASAMLQHTEKPLKK